MKKTSDTSGPAPPRRRRGKSRLDVALVDRGLVETRSKAQALIMARRVLVNDQFMDKPGTNVADDDMLRVAELEHPWVGRGGMKLAHALKEFAIDVRGKTCADIGASTGGFTDVLLKSGAISAPECLRFALSQPTSVVITGIDSQQVLDQALQMAREFKMLTTEETKTLLSKTARAAEHGEFELFKTTGHFDSTATHPEWLGGETAQVKKLGGDT